MVLFSGFNLFSKEMIFAPLFWVSDLQLHGDDVYFTLEEAAQRPDSVLAAGNAASSKV